MNIGRGRRPLWRLWIIAGLVIVLLAGVLSILTLLAFSRPPSPVPVPSRVAGVPLRAHLFGQEAADEIVRLHRSRFPLTGAAVAVYGETTAILWVGQTWGDGGAQVLLWWMTRAIERSDSPFRPVGQRRVRDVLVYELRGMGQTHFYFRVEDRIYWLAVDPDLAGRGLQELVDFALKAAGRSARESAKAGSCYTTPPSLPPDVSSLAITGSPPRLSP